MFCPQLVPMVLDGRKPLTRRGVQITLRTPGLAACLLPPVGKPRPHVAAELCPYGHPGDRLWMRETFYAWGRWETRFSSKKGRDEWHFVDLTQECGMAYRYHADETLLVPPRGMGGAVRWWKRPAIFMPLVASRCNMELQAVRVERLQDITEADALREGIVRQPDGGYGLPDTTHYHAADPRMSFWSLWESINGTGSVDANPWVWVLSFNRLP
ncbi:hypothetical protein [Acidovorax sp. Root219]|uniref:hypothetical protein n=1 Tax=Acidovorax sp. Root219 TaxID=1736493 RepID=UPI00071419F5|nr:hypothetical protein [Acidovorax sp. Root219]KRC36271.1 hypothetical protein ASE28_01695 [Acidovorax sp. Root219]